MPKVYLYESDGDLRVYPPIVLVTAADSTVTLENMSTEDPVTWEVNGKKNTVSKSMSITFAKANRGATTYSVVAGKRRAKGNSDPVIIIDT